MHATDLRWRVYVVELADVVPRRRPDRPNLFVGITSLAPELAVDRLAQSVKRHRWVREHVVRLRGDLFRNYQPTTEEDARRQKRKLIEKLMRRGYTVNRITDVWRVYVIELDDDESGIPAVYVGQTTLDPEERLHQHLSGARNKKGPLYSKVVHRRGRVLRPDLYASVPVQCTRDDALRAEAALAEALRRDGYEVYGGH